MKKQPTQNKGFTLIETLVYLALLGLVFTGLLTAGFAIVQSLDVLKLAPSFRKKAILFWPNSIGRWWVPTPWIP